MTVYAIARGGAGVLNFCAVALYTRLLLPEEYGRYALLMASSGVIAAVSFQWLRAGARRFLQAYRHEQSAFLASLARAYLLTVLALAVLAIAATLVVAAPWLRGLVLLGLGLLIVQGWFDLNLELLLAGIEPVRYGWFSLGRSVLSLGTGAVLAGLGYGAIGVVTGAIVGYAVPAMIMALSRWRNIRLAAASSEMQGVFLAFGLPLTATYALDFVVGYSDRLLVGALAGVGEAGRYSVAYDLPQQTMTALMMVVNLASFPHVVRSVEEQGFSGAAPQVLRHGSLVALLGIPAMVGLALLAPNIAYVFLGAQFRDGAAELIPIIAVAAFIGGLKSFVFDLSFQLGRNTRTQVWVSGVAAALNILLNFWWIPAHGGLGAAYATLVSLSVGLLLSWRLGSLRLRLPLALREWGKIAISAGVMGAIIIQIESLRGPVALLLQVLVGVMSFGLLLLAFDVLGCRRMVMGSRTQPSPP